MSKAHGYSMIAIVPCKHGTPILSACADCTQERELAIARPTSAAHFASAIDAAGPWFRCCNLCDFWLGEHREWCQWRAFDEAVSGDLAAQAWDEGPYVCPGCYAAAPERCAPGCIDAEIEEDARHEREHDSCECIWAWRDRDCPVHGDEEEESA